MLINFVLTLRLKNLIVLKAFFKMINLNFLRLGLFFLSFGLPFLAVANNPFFLENKGQWHSDVRFQASFGSGGAAYITKTGFTFIKYDNTRFDSITLLKASGDKFPNEFLVNSHAYQVSFSNTATGQILSRAANNTPLATGLIPEDSRFNFIHGNDPALWATDVKGYREVKVNRVALGTDLRVYFDKGSFKYDLIVQPQYDASTLRVNYTGTESLRIDAKGNLIIQTSVGNVIESMPYTYQIIEGKEVAVPCRYVLTEGGQQVGFVFPDGYQKNLPLVIDPRVIGASYSGAWATGRNVTHWAFCSGYDKEGNFYSGGGFNAQTYPVTTGAFQSNFGGGTLDIALAKYNPDLSKLLYATFIGGTDWDQMAAIHVDEQRQVNILGLSRSDNFPVTATAFQRKRAGAVGYQDYTVSKLSANGSTLLGSTYIGGSDAESNAIKLHIGDGEIATDAAGNVYIVGQSVSTDFPTTQGAFQTTKGSNYDGVAVKFKPDLSGLIWSTFIGGNGLDACYDMKLTANGSMYISGTTASTDFKLAGRPFKAQFEGGQGLFTVGADGFVVKVAPDGKTLEAGTYFGNGLKDDLIIKIDLDRKGNVVFTGITSGFEKIGEGTQIVPVKPACAQNNLNSHQFIGSFSSDLSQLVFARQFGGEGLSLFPQGDFLPSALTVDSCDIIYLSGRSSNTLFPFTSDAFTKTETGLFLAVFAPAATKILFASNYAAGSGTAGHSQRISKDGILYHVIEINAVNNSNFTTTPTAYAKSYPVPMDYDLAMVKIDLKVPFQADFVNKLNPTYSLCNAPSVDVDVTQTGCYLYEYLWNDGTTNPKKTLSQAGDYSVTISVGCSQMVYKTKVEKGAVLAQVDLGKDTMLCTGKSLTLNATIPNASKYAWSDGATSSTVIITTAGTYAVTISNDCGVTITDEIKVSFDADCGCKVDIPNAFTPNGDILNDAFGIIKKGDCTSMSDFNMQIYNRWGNKVYETTNPDQPWDGKLDGNPSSSDVYVFVIKYTLLGSSEQIRKSGEVALIR
jgi:gliding motility-associated-like protein